jgi:hypothetical protein
MRFAVIALCASFLVSGIPCPHAVHAMEMSVSVARMSNAAMMSGVVHADDMTVDSGSHRISPRTDDSCCINIANTSAEADQIQ